MVVRTRWRVFLVPVLLYMVSGSVGAYFVWHANNGERGLKAKASYVQQIDDLQGQLSQLRAERERWQRKVDMMSGDSIDRDLLEEEARTILGYVDKRDLTIFYSQANKSPN
jgi:cell division protein FtsB